MLSTPSTQLIEQLLFGTLEFCGQVADAFCSTGYAFLLLKSSSDMLLSREGVTQGDPLSMMFYSVATLPLVRALKGNGHWFQSWYADDSVCAGSLGDIRCWLDCLLELDPFLWVLL